MGQNDNLYQLQQPADIKDVLSAQEKDFDCLPCRLMGTSSLHSYTQITTRHENTY